MVWLNWRLDDEVLEVKKGEGRCHRLGVRLFTVERMFEKSIACFQRKTQSSEEGLSVAKIPSLLLVVFVIQLVIHLIHTIGDIRYRRFRMSHHS